MVLPPPSSSSPSSLGTTKKTQMKYDVFLSFRGSDTRDNFTSHLFAALERRNIQTFMDDGLNTGEEINSSLLKAIEESMVSVIVFSQNYADSPWCLDELVKIMECKENAGQVVLPVFYHVDPSDIEDQTGWFGNGFKRLKVDHHMGRVEKWRDALRKASSIAGFDWRNHRPDHKLTEEVAESVLKELKCALLTGSLSGYSGLVGIDSRFEQILSLLCIGSPNVLFLGIWGMGGIGKTTCAETLFYQISGEFEDYYFLANVREESRKNTIICLRNRIIGKILGEEITTSTPNVLPNFILNRLRRKKVLVVLDDVNNEEQLRILAGQHDWYGPGSRIIVTSRDKQVLIHEVDEIYEVKGLDYDDALQLFSLQAFKQNNVDDSFLELSKTVLNYAKGVPLALKVLGSLLYKRHSEEWKSKLKKLGKIPEQQIHNVLRISYDELDEDEQNIFLDIACFFKGEDKDWVKDILDGCGFYASIGISRLHDKCLITIIDNKLQMHDLLQEMGWEIVSKESKDYGKRSRLCKAEEIFHVLSNNTGTELTQGIVLDMDKIFQEMDFNSVAFSRMHALRVLKLYFSSYQTWGATLRGFISETSAQSCNSLRHLPHSLRDLRWHGYPWKILPHDFSPEKLVDLKICYSQLEQLWLGAKPLQQLKWLELTCSWNLILLPDLSSAVNLEKIILDSCGSLLEIPTSIQHLQKLSYLSLSNCWRIRNLPSLICLESLLTLNLSGCSDLTQFPEIPSNIKELYLDNTGLEEWPSSIRFLNHLVFLTLEECEELRSLPSSLHCASLETFTLSWCSNLKRIPDIVGENLKVLDLAASGIEELPSSIGCLTSLVKLRLDHTNIKELPTSIGNLYSLLELHLDCTEIEELPSSIGCLTSLVKLRLDHTNIKELPTSIGNLYSLLELHLDCTEIEELPSSIGSLSSLVHLNLTGTLIKELPLSIGHLSSLVIMDLCCCERLKGLPSSICELKCLEKLTIASAPNLCKLPNLFGLHTLKELDLRSCSIQELPVSLGNLSALQYLYLGKSDIKWIPSSIIQLSLLEKLDLQGCKSLQSLPMLPSLISYVDATNCTSLKKVSCSFINVIEKSWQDQLPPDYRFIFANCKSLDKNSRGNIMSLLKNDQDVETMLRKFSVVGYYPGRPKLRVCLPENKIPEWFQYQSMGSCIHASFSTWYKMSSVGLALCALVGFKFDYDSTDELFGIRCQCNLRNHNGDVLCIDFDMGAELWHCKFRFESDHVFIWFVRNLYDFKGSEAGGYLKEASFEFSASSVANVSRIKMCGAHLVYF